MDRRWKTKTDGHRPPLLEQSCCSVEPSICATPDGTRPAFLQAVNFYEVLADGYHSPLTKTQISELFHAGRLRRNHPCKQVTQKKWRTIDELFPLLKYQSAGPALYDSREANAPSARTWILIFLFLAAACAAAALWYYFAYNAAVRTDLSHVTARNWPRTIATPSTLALPVPQPEQTDNVSVDAPATTYVPRTPVEQSQAPFTEQRRQAEQQQQQRERASAQAERDRLMAERTRLEQKPAWQDVIVALDKDTLVNVGGISVHVRIHENDVTSFDVWINGVRRREVPTQKGITGSRTDETLIHGSGPARLYYVWEITGELNHCRLRVRED
jgi:hypothetical protein